MTLSEDFEDFIKTLNKHHVDYLIVGGYAMVFHAYANKLTIDLEGYQANYIGLDELIQNRKASSRKIDISDVEDLEAPKRKKPNL